MKHHLAQLAAAVVLSLLTTLAAGQDDTPKASPQDAPEVEPALLKQLKELDERLAKIKDMQARFTQTKHVSLLKKPLVSQGDVLIKGQQMRWDVTKPSPSTTLTSAKEIRIHYPQQKIVEVYFIDERLASVVASPLPRLDVLLGSFKVERAAGPKDGDKEKEADRLHLSLTPRSEELKKHITRVNVTIDTTRALAQRIEMIDIDGDRTEITFDAIQLNVGLKDDRFELKLPEGTRVVRPLEAVEPRNP
ncbi:MAG: outer membrane lipoprotein carrier protein LolA [Phycisphaeraceae bacterium]